MTPRIIFIITLFIGLGLFFYSWTLPYYADQVAKDKLDYEATKQIGGEEYRDFKEHYYAEVTKLKTYKTTFMDLGAGIAIASMTILIFIFLQRVQKFSDFKNVTSVGKVKLIVGANLFWLALIPRTYWYYIFRGGRGDYPWFADSIGIPIMYQIPEILFGFIPMNIFLLFSFINSNHPTNIFIRPKHYNTKEVFKEIFWGFWFLLNLLCLVLFVIDGDHVSIPVNLYFTFVLLNLRAGQISRTQLIEQPISN